MVLGKLKTLGQIRIIIDLLIEGAPRLYVAIQCQAGQGCLFKGFHTEPGHRARQPETDGTDIRIGIIPGPVGTVAKHFCGAAELDVYLKTDYRFINHRGVPPYPNLPTGPR